MIIAKTISLGACMAFMASGFMESPVTIDIPACNGCAAAFVVDQPNPANPLAAGESISWSAQFDDGECEDDGEGGCDIVDFCSATLNIILTVNAGDCACRGIPADCGSGTTQISDFLMVGGCGTAGALDQTKMYVDPGCGGAPVWVSYHEVICTSCDIKLPRGF